MKIDKVINNNIVRSTNEQGNEVLVMGCGLGFKKVAGDTIDSSKIEKIYTFTDNSKTNKLEEVLADVSLESLQICNEIVDLAKEKYQIELNDNIYLTLSDHIHWALQRFKEGISVRNALVNEISRFYPTEYEIGTKALEIIHSKANVSLPIDEAGFIAVHIVNALNNGTTLQQTQQMLEVIDDVVNIIKFHFNIEIDQQTIYFQRFITHLKFFVTRVFSGQELNDDNDENFFLMIRSQYKKEYTCAMKVYDYFYKQYNIELSNDEMVYLTIHIRRISSK